MFIVFFPSMLTNRDISDRIPLSSLVGGLKYVSTFSRTIEFQYLKKSCSPDSASGIWLLSEFENTSVAYEMTGTKTISGTTQMPGKKNYGSPIFYYHPLV